MVRMERWLRFGRLYKLLTAHISNADWHLAERMCPLFVDSYGEDWSVIVIQIAECTSLTQIDNTFWGTREASARYGVAPGQIHQYVGLNDAAWAVGDWEWKALGFY